MEKYSVLYSVIIVQEVIIMKQLPEPEFFACFLSFGI